MKLSKIKSEDLIFNHEAGEDYTYTFLALNDYDWMDYSLVTYFNTKEQGALNVKFNYCGLVVSTMEVEQELNHNNEKIVYEYSTDIFQKYLIKYLEKHIRNWDSSYGFDGEEEVISFFNDVIENGVLISK